MNTGNPIDIVNFGQKVVLGVGTDVGLCKLSSFARPRYANAASVLSRSSNKSVLGEYVAKKYFYGGLLSPQLEQQLKTLSTAASNSLEIGGDEEK